MSDSLDEAIKSFLIWKGIAHCVMVGYSTLTGIIIWQAWELGAAITTQQTFLVGTLTGVLPVMLNWYAQVMATVQGSPKA